MSKKKKEEKVEVAELVKGVSIDIENAATKIVVEGVPAGKSEDELKQAIFSLGVPFSKLNQLYKAILKNEGLAVDVKALRASIEELIAKSEFTYKETLLELKEYAKSVVENVPNATTARVLAMLKKHWKENEMEFPRKAPAARGKMGAINKAIIDAFKANQKTSVEELEAALSDATKKPAAYAKSMHPLAYALANGLSALEVLTVIAKTKETA